MSLDSIRVAIDSTRTANVYNVSRLSVLDSEIWGGCSDKFKWCGVV